jgi:predicted membrane chloride channel (bestrophin family)
MWTSLIISGAVYIACCLPLSISEFLHPTVPLYKSVIAMVIFILPGLACLLEGAFFISRSGKTRASLADNQTV